MLNSFSAALLLAGALPAAFAQDPPTVRPSTEVGKLPALGWNSWNAYHCDVTQALVLQAAHDIAATGLADAGYKYVNIDDCWSTKSRDENGRLVPDPVKFPDGIKGTAEEVHALGLKFGIYGTAGTTTCAGYPASLEHEEIDAQTWADWDVDYLKYDNCNVPDRWADVEPIPDNDWYNSNSSIRFRRMTAALAATGRTFEIDICIWGGARVWEWGAKVGHSWRMTGDITPDWQSVYSIIRDNARHLDTIDHWGHNDMDMMEIGNGGLTLQEERTHFAAWVYMKSPILLGTTISNLNAEQLSILKNPELLAYHQDDEVGTPAMPFRGTAMQPSTETPEYYFGYSKKGLHVFISNWNNTALPKVFEFSRIPGLGTGTFLVHDMWTGTDLGTFTGNFTTKLDAHDTAALFVSRV